MGAHIGVQVRADERVRVGARYLSQVTLDYEGDARFEPVSTGLVLPADNPFGFPAGTPVDALLQGAGLFAEGAPLGDQGVTTEITMPDQLVAGVAFDATDRLLLLADWQWMDWSDFDRVRLDFENPATPDEVVTPLLPEASRNQVSLGGGWRSPTGFEVNVAYLFIGQEDRRGRTVEPRVGEQPSAALNNGLYGFRGHLFAATATYHF